jgi:hypothetical protein
MVESNDEPVVGVTPGTLVALDTVPGGVPFEPLTVTLETTIDDETYTDFSVAGIVDSTGPICEVATYDITDDTPVTVGGGT